MPFEEVFLLFTFKVIEGYEIACKKAHEILPDLVCCSAKSGMLMKCKSHTLPL